MSINHKMIIDFVLTDKSLSNYICIFSNKLFEYAIARLANRILCPQYIQELYFLIGQW